MGPERFEYSLPRDLIAQTPVEHRDGARLLVSLGDRIEHSDARTLPRRLSAMGALVVLNDTRVVPARIELARADGRHFELLFCRPVEGLGPGSTVDAWVRGARRLAAGDVLQAPGLAVRFVGGSDPHDTRARRFVVEQGDVLGALGQSGAIPLPPYIERMPSAVDADRYQTVFAPGVRIGCCAHRRSAFHQGHARWR